MQVAVKMKQLEKALELFDMAIDKSFKMNFTFHFRKAYTLFQMERYQEALEELEPLKMQARELEGHLMGGESNVYLLCGKIYKQLGNGHEAILMFSMAQDYHLSTRQFGHIKDCIGK